MPNPRRARRSAQPLGVKHASPNVAAIEVSEVEYLRLSEFERFDDGSGYRCNIDARSGEFGCSGKVFYFDDMRR